MDRTPADVWSCLAEPRRRHLLDLLAESDQGVLELAETLGVSAATCSHHLGAMRRAGLVGHRKEGRYRDYYLQPTGLEMASQWLNQLRQKRGRPGWNQEAYREHCLAAWLGGSKDRLPAHPRRRQVVLEWFHSLLERGRMLTMEDLERVWGPHAQPWEPVLAELERQGRLERRERYILVSD